MVGLTIPLPPRTVAKGLVNCITYGIPKCIAECFHDFFTIFNVFINIHDITN